MKMFQELPIFQRKQTKKTMPVVQKQERDPQNEEVELWTEKD